MQALGNDLPLRLINRRDRPEAPFRHAGHQHDAVSVDHIDRLAADVPVGLQPVELDLSDDDAKRPPVGGIDAAGDIKTRPAADIAERIMFGHAGLHRRLEIFAKSIIGTDKAVRLPPIARRNRQSGRPGHIDHRGLRTFNKPLQLAVQPIEGRSTTTIQRGGKIGIS
ncbi:hypothetical protein D3C71_574440 [compost metagenome]